jgi:hypothetical protein
MNVDLEFVLKEVKKFAPLAKERTLFAVGGRGYYENPASDLLAFFFRPNAEHGLEDLFLSTYLECMKEDPRQFNMNISNDDMEREVVTKDDSRIDLQILGQDWCLLIENKIYHWQANPFKSYELHAKGLGKGKMLFSILSPDGISKADGWKGVSYPDYCKALQQKMPEIDSYNRQSKWQLFAREFILHMKNELDNPPMTDKQALFVEEHAAELFQARKYFEEYPNYLCSILKEKLWKELGYAVVFNVFNWGIVIKSPERWGNASIAFRTPTDWITDDGARTNNFDISIYPDEGELKRGQSNASQSDLLKGMRYDSKGVWLTKKGFKDRNEAINDLIPRIKLIERSPSS